MGGLNVKGNLSQKNYIDIVQNKPISIHFTNRNKIQIGLVAAAVNNRN